MRWFGLILSVSLLVSCTTSTDPSDLNATCDDTTIIDATGTEIDASNYDGLITITQYGHGVGPLWGTYSVEATFLDRDYGRSVSAGGLMVGNYQIAPKQTESGDVIYALTEPYDGTPQDVTVPIEIGGDPVTGFRNVRTTMYVPPQFTVEIAGYEHGTGHRDTISLSSDLTLEWDAGSMTDAKVTVTLAYQPDEPNAERKTWSYTYENTGECTIPRSALQQLAPPGATFNLWLRRTYTRCVAAGSKRILITSKAAMYSWVRSVE